MPGFDGRLNAVIYKGVQYSTLDDVPVDGSALVYSPMNFLSPPAGWSLATYRDDLRTGVVAARYWSTSRLIFSNGAVYNTLTSGPGTYWSSGMLQQSGSSYRGRFSDLQILISSK